jgi:hypothetical protein
MDEPASNYPIGNRRTKLEMPEPFVVLTAAGYFGNRAGGQPSGGSIHECFSSGMTRRSGLCPTFRREIQTPWSVVTRARALSAELRYCRSIIDQREIPCSRSISKSARGTEGSTRLCSSSELARTVAPEAFHWAGALVNISTYNQVFLDPPI